MAPHRIPNCYICNHFVTVIITSFNCQIFHFREEKVFSSRRTHAHTHPCTHSHTHALMLGSVLCFPACRGPPCEPWATVQGDVMGLMLASHHTGNLEGFLSAIMDPLSAVHSTAGAEDIFYQVLAWAWLSSFGTWRQRFRRFTTLGQFRTGIAKPQCAIVSTEYF